VALLLFAPCELTTTQPLLELRVFRSPDFSLAIASLGTSTAPSLAFPRADQDDEGATTGWLSPDTSTPIAASNLAA
jgi:hypothetical protein